MIPEIKPTRVFYHATSQNNLRSIFDIGVSPAYAKGNRKAIWFVPKSGIQSGIYHAIHRHDLRFYEVEVVTIEVVVGHIRYSGNSMLYYSLYSAKALDHAPAFQFVDESEKLP
jgi:hypothetical protein